MLYALEGLPLEGDAYDIPNYDRVLYRPIIKTLLNTLINAESEQGAIKSLLRTDKAANTSKKVRNHLRKAGLIRSDNTQNIQATIKLIHAIKQKHYPIEKYLGSGEGIKLQRRDSSMAQRIMLNMLNAGIPCLPVHDSFIVPYPFAFKLLGEMKRAFAHDFGLQIDVDVKSVPMGFEQLRYQLQQANLHPFPFNFNALPYFILSNGIQTDSDRWETERNGETEGKERGNNFRSFSTDSERRGIQGANQC